MAEIGAASWEKSLNEREYLQDVRADVIVERNRKAGQNPPRVVAPIEEVEDEYVLYPARYSHKTVDLYSRDCWFKSQPYCSCRG